MYEVAQVVNIKNNSHITVACNTSACESCHAGALCSTKGKTFTAKNSSEKPLKKGDMVELYLPPGKTIFAGFITLMVPLILFPIGYYLAMAFLPTSSELIHILIGVGGIAVGFFLSGMFSKIQSSQYTPEITRIIE
ncbi:MAG: Fis family transcriptional regulator [Spirochaetia bacterium]|nr:Fis family transcriptional regulator [Spirochaetia bacterium]